VWIFVTIPELVMPTIWEMKSSITMYCSSDYFICSILLTQVNTKAKQDHTIVDKVEK